MSILVARRSTSIAICSEVAGPPLANVILPGLALASATSSCTVFHGALACTTSGIGVEARLQTGSKFASVKLPRLTAMLTTKALATSSTVLPSGSARAAASVPMVMPPPGRFSTTTVGPPAFWICSPIRREMMSGPLPGV